MNLSQMSQFHMMNHRFLRGLLHGMSKVVPEYTVINSSNTIGATHNK